MFSAALLFFKMLRGLPQLTAEPPNAHSEDDGPDGRQPEQNSEDNHPQRRRQREHRHRDYGPDDASNRAGRWLSG